MQTRLVMSMAEDRYRRSISEEKFQYIWQKYAITAFERYWSLFNGMVSEPLSIWISCGCCVPDLFRWCAESLSDAGVIACNHAAGR